MKVEFSRQIFEKSEISNSIKIRPVGADLLHANGHTDGWTDGRTNGYDEANSRIFAILRTRLKALPVTNYSRAINGVNSE